MAFSFRNVCYDIPRLVFIRCQHWLLYLDRRAKPTGAINNSSFSNNFITNTNHNNISSNNNNHTTTIATANSNNNNVASVGLSPRKWCNKRNSRGFSFLVFHQQSQPSPPLTSQIPSETPRSFSLSSPINKYPSSISLLKLNQTNLNSTTVFHHGSTQYHTPRSRRQRRYLRGLLGLSISNLSLSLSLLSWCICQIIMHNISNTRHTLKAWLTMIAFTNIWTVDIAQALETGAILWIALERTLGIHWPSETQTSNGNNNNSVGSNTLSTNTNNSTRRTQYSYGKYNGDVDLRRTRLNHLRFKMSLTNSLKITKDSLNRLFLNSICFNRCITHDYYCSCCSSALLTHSTLLIGKKSSKKRISCFIRLFLCLLPLVLFLIASMYSLTIIIHTTRKQRLHNQSSISYYEQHHVNIISDMKTTYISSMNRNDNNFTQNFNPLVIYNYYYTYFTSVLRKQLPFYTVHIKHQVYMYYTSSIISALVIGQFLAPLAILVTTNLLIYQKVASRDKRFFSRQSSNTSKSSFVSGVSISSVNASSSPSTRKLTTATINFPIPLLRVLESSNQDVRIDVDEDNTTTGEQSSDTIDATKPSGQSLFQQQQRQHTLSVPLTDMNEKTYPFSPATNIAVKQNETFLHTTDETRYLLSERRNSTSVIQPAISYTELYDNNNNTTLSSKTTTATTMTATSHRYSESSIKLSTVYSLQKRRKSSNDIFTSLFQSRGQDQNSRTGEEPILLQVLRRQHRRTLRILIILLLVFVLCRAPRSIVLMIEWLRHTCFKKCEPHLSSWLQYTSIFAYSSAVLDTIVYGFWEIVPIGYI
ncbi:unnamed protein product [Heterobilharzia americana]|nr:unnamed protein product [Heterobilharzia americana]